MALTLRWSLVSLVVSLSILFATTSATAQGVRATAGDETCGQSREVVGVCGTALWRPLMLRTEIGMTMLRTKLDAQSSSGGVLNESTNVDARLATLRFLFGYTGYYGGTEISLGRVDTGGLVVGAPSLPRIEDPDEAGTLRDFAVAGSLIGGREVRFGRLALGVELQIGVGVVTVGGGEQMAPYVTDARFLLDARVRGGVWLTRHISLMGHVGASLVNPGDRMYGLMLGLTPMPYDGI